MLMQAICFAPRFRTPEKRVLGLSRVERRRRPNAVLSGFLRALDPRPTPLSPACAAFFVPRDGVLHTGCCANSLHQLPEC